MFGSRSARRVAAALAGTVATALLASACASSAGFGGPPSSIAVDEGQGWPPDAPVPEPAFTGVPEPIAWWNEGEPRATMTIVTYGSSSCPFVLTQLDGVGEAALAATFDTGRNDACTDDLAPRYHVVSAPEGVTAEEVRLDIEFRDPEPVQRLSIRVIDPNVDNLGRPESIALDEYPGLPERVPEPAPEAPSPEAPLAYWLSPVVELANERELTIVTYGSSSCPVIPTVVDPGAGDGLIGVTLQERRLPDEFCTEDFAPFTSVVAVPLEAAARATDVLFTTIAPGAAPVERTVPIVDLAG